MDRIDFGTAIAAQPRWMARTAEVASQALGGGEGKPWALDETVAIIGMGASTHAGTVFVEALRAAGQRAINLDASAVARYPAGFRVAEHVIVVSESGRSPEPIAAVARLGVRPIVVTNEASSPVAALGSVVPLGGFVDSGVYTIGYTTTLVALAAVAQAYGVPLVDPASLADVAADALAGYGATAEVVAEAVDSKDFLDLVGSGPSYGSAQAAALLLREAVALPTAAHETLQYLHGPMEACGPRSAVLVYGGGRGVTLAAQLRAAGAYVAEFQAPVPNAYAAAVAETVFAQLVAAALATRRGSVVGEFRFPQPDTKLPRTL
ncbi:MAG: hypothetical protein LBI33_08145 [Propionibacteriaceae bacterium]|jgi:fructoselysine-6-P-deglycase FrlB-like protein|nr:hypothetical protein [Propionibacteriaceae bacterium]